MRDEERIHLMIGEIEETTHLIAIDVLVNLL